MNNIYKSLLHSKINQFVNDFRTSKDLFENLAHKNKLLHPGEFGMFRENICEELIKFTIPSKFKTGTGFLINSFDEISSQCDIIIYDLNNTPLIQDGSYNRFFPVEPVIGVGEIKSDLTQGELCKALLKLAKNKELRKIDGNRTSCVNNPNKVGFQPSINCYDNIFSFLICNEIKGFKLEKFKKKIDDFYVENHIKYEFRHNIILSLTNGVFTYINQFNNLGNALPENQIIYFPKFLDKEFNNLYSNKSVIENVTLFLTSLSNFFMNVNIYYPEPNTYT